MRCSIRDGVPTPLRGGRHSGHDAAASARPSGTQQRIGTYPEFTLVEFPPALVHELDVLSGALDDPGPDLHAMLRLLTDDLTAAIPSFLGLIITSHLGDDVVTVRTVESRTAKSSLLLR